MATTVLRHLRGLVRLLGLARAGDPASSVSAAERLLEQTREFYVAIDQDGLVLRWNPAAAALFGYSQEHALGRHLDGLIIPAASHAAHEAGIERFLRTGKGRGLGEPVEVEAVRADGTLVPVELSIWADHTPTGWVFHALGHDLVRHRRQAQVLEVLSSHRRGLLLSEHPDAARRLLCATVRTAVQSQAVYLYEPDEEDPTVFRLTAESLHLAPPGRHSVVAGPALTARLLAAGSEGLRVTRAQLDDSAAADLLRETGLQTFLVRPLLRSGALVGVLLLGWLVPDRDTASPDPSLLDLLSSEAVLVFERLQTQEQLRQAARTDPLTGLVNRREHDLRLADAVRQAERDGTPLSLLVLDLDRFKAYNDAHGHPAGDALLVAAAAAWSEVLDPAASLARLGGDEFAVLLPDADPGRARDVAEQLRAATPGAVGLTVGSATHEPGGTEEELLRRADADLYDRKRRR